MSQFYVLPVRILRGCLLLLLVFLISFRSTAQLVVGFNPVISGLTSPIDIVNAGDGSKRIFIVQQNGTIKVYDSLYNPLGDFVAVAGISSGGERGLLSMAFHPDYKNNGFFFVYYTNTAGDVEVARYQVTTGMPDVADPTTKQVVLTIPHPGQSNHNGGKLNFGSDGYLYFATGDGGGGGDVPNNAQNGNSLLGKMIRINVTTSASAPFYTIPPDNPFQVPGDNILDEIWALGLRNPFRWSFDRLTHDAWIGDVGQDLWEEVDYRPNGNTGGLNYGWHCIEGTHNYNGGCPIVAGVYAPPLFDYPHNNATGGFAIIGGYVYRGTKNPALYGYYIFADNVSSNVWVLPPGGTVTDTIEYRSLFSGISAFGEDENGELYATSLGGGLYNVTATNNTLPLTLLNFTGTKKEGYNELAWSTTNEKNIRQFEIEYSTDGTHFQQAGIVAPSNTDNYYFKHAIIVNARLYYRLRMVDTDGRAAYSKVIVLNNVQENNFVVPSVIIDHTLTVNLDGSFSSLQLVNMDGRELYSQSINNRSGRISLIIPALPVGQYLVRLQGDGKQLTQKIFIK